MCQSARSKRSSCSDTANVCAENDDAIKRIEESVHCTRVVSVTCNTSCANGTHHPNVEVFIAWPLVEFRTIVTNISFHGLDTVNTVCAVSVRIKFRQTYFDFTSSGNSLELRNDIGSICIQFAEVFVEDIHLIENLCIRNILGAVIMNDVKHNRYDIRWRSSNTILF